MNLQNKPQFSRVAKFMLPFVSRLFANRFANSVVRYNELASCLIQGKGSGEGWDMTSEVSIAARFIETKTPVLMDVGANFGIWSRGMLELFPQCAMLLMVEPQSKCLEALAENEFPRKVIFPCAVADQPGKLSFFTSVGHEGWGAASLFERLDTYFSDTQQQESLVPVLKLDDIIEQSGVSTVDFMKMDIEGAEFLALKGAEASIRSGRIKALSFEFGSGNINSRTYFRDLWDFLTGQEFSIFRILPGGKVLKIEEYYEDLEYFRGVTNYVATAGIR